MKMQGIYDKIDSSSVSKNAMETEESGFSNMLLGESSGRWLRCWVRHCELRDSQAGSKGLNEQDYTEETSLWKLGIGVINQQMDKG